MSIEVITVFPPDSAVDILVPIKNRAGTLVTPTGSIEISIWDPDGTLQVDGESMTQIDDADDPADDYYEYVYHMGTGLDPMDKGEWIIKVIAIDGSGDDAISSPKYGSFIVR